MRIDVVKLPRDLSPALLQDRTVVVFDVLRATTSMITALNFGAKEIRIFDSLDSVRRDKTIGLRCGEERCFKPPDFDRGNSPRDFADANLAGQTLLMSTTNGTRAILAALDASEIFVASTVNASAMARLLALENRHVTLLCSGTEGEFAIEDFLGAGAVIDRFPSDVAIELSSDAADAHAQFVASRDRLPEVFRAGAGGQHILAAGLDPDIDFAARLDVFDLVGRVMRDPLRVAREES